MPRDFINLLVRLTPTDKRSFFYAVDNVRDSILVWIEAAADSDFV